MPPSPQETRTYTRIESPKRVRFVRFVWGILAVFTLSIYIIGFMDFYGVLRRGMPLIDQSQLLVEEGRVLIRQPSAELQAAGLRDGDILQAINGDEALVEELRDKLLETPSSHMMNFPANVGNVGDTITLQLEDRDISLPLTTPNNLMARSFTKLGLSLDAAAIFAYLIEAIYALGFLVMAGLIFLNRSDDWMALLVASALLFLGLSTGLASHTDSIVILAEQFRFVVFASGVVAYIAAYLFPEGNIAPKWSLIFPALYLMQLPISYVIAIESRSTAVGLFIRVAYVVGIVGLPITLLHRYRRLFTREQKQQSKWMLLGLMSFIIGLVIVSSYRQLYLSGFSEVATLYFALSFPIETVLSLGLPIALAFAIMQYRIWDIDLVLNRSVVVAGVFVILTGIFAAVFLLTQTLITSIAGNSVTSIAVGISALVVGVAFNPARSRVQHFIDRKLFRLRFDLNQLQAAQERGAKAGVFSGQVVDDYFFGEIIGRGGMGEVYKGYKDSKVVAIKTLRDDVISDIMAKERFMRESQISIEHPNIAGVLDVGEIKGVNYMVLQFIEGRNLKDHLRECITLDVESAVSIACDICAGLEATHKAGYVHRDIKPANIILRPKGDNENFQAVITDFGVVKLNDASTTLTGTGAIGTIDYMSPEQIRTSTAVDHRADIYALGVMLYEMLTGERPFSGTVIQVLFSHLNQPPPDISKKRTDIPVNLGIAIMRAMSKEAPDRYESAKAFSEALKKSIS
jgi:tRNA A-37 threonylcarbamoyl transferase component Bud32